MNTEGVERVVIAEAGFDLRDHEIAEDSGGESDEQRGHWAYETCCRCDGDQARDRTGDGPERAGLTVAHPLSARPPDNCGCGREVRSHKRAGRLFFRQKTAYEMRAKSSHSMHESRLSVDPGLGWTLVLPRQWYVKGSAGELVLSLI